MAVADGVGGGPGGEIAADAAVEMLASRFFDAPAGLTIEERLAEAVREANTAVLRAAESSGKPQAASTLVAAAVRDERAIIANLGDSRAYLVRGGAPRQVTEDHAASVAHGITRFVGDPRGVQPDVFVEDLQTGDRLVLCSDGLTRHVAPEEIAGAVSGSLRSLTRVGDRPLPPLDAALDTLIALANSRGGEDNVTCVIYAAEARSRVAMPSRRGLGLGVLAALVTIAVVGGIAALLSLAPFAAPPAGSAPASATPSASASATETATPSPTPTPTPSPSETPSATP